MGTLYIVLGIIVVVVFTSFLTVSQGSIAVITLFGKYQRILMPGLRMKIPIFEKIYRQISPPSNTLPRPRVEPGLKSS